jgi:hypothetical protein
LAFVLAWVVYGELVFGRAIFDGKDLSFVALVLGDVFACENVWLLLLDLYHTGVLALGLVEVRGEDRVLHAKSVELVDIFIDFKSSTGV